MKISLLVVADEKNGIGRENQLLCHLPADLKYFKKLTTGHHVLMGRKTYDSIGKPLVNRPNIVVSHTVKEIAGCLVFNSLDPAIRFAREAGEEELFIIGGAKIFEQSMDISQRIYLTRVHHVFEDADVFFPELDEKEWKLASSDPHQADDKNAWPYTFEVYERS